MNQIVLVMTFMFVSSCFSQELVEHADFGSNPGNLKMFLHVPKELNESTAVPLVVALHGCSQTAQSMSEQSGWNQLADKYGFIVLYPQQRVINNASTCFNWFMRKDIEGDNGELRSIREMVNTVKGKYAIDEGKVFTYGLSAGAAMANSILANNPTEFAGGAILAGGPHMSATNVFQSMKVMMNPDDLRPEERGIFINAQPGETKLPKVIVYHGTKDNVVDPDNADELIDQWAFAYDMDVVPDKEEKSFNDNWQVDRIAYSSSSKEEAIIYYKLYDIGHKLAVDPGTDKRQGGQTGVYAVDIDFFSTYWIAKDFGLTD